MAIPANGPADPEALPNRARQQADPGRARQQADACETPSDDAATAEERGAGRMLALARTIDPERSPICAARLEAVLPRGSLAHALGTLLSSAYPALAPVLETFPEIARALAAEGYHAARDRASILALVTARIVDFSDPERVQRELRRAARDERIRIALRELLPLSLGGADLDVTAGELAALADATIEIALGDAARAVAARFGPLRTAGGAPARFVVLGMGKLGGEELNAGSDVDLLYFYDTDDGAAVAPDGSSISLHDAWTRVARRLTATLEEVTADGFVWRVDLRLRPEGRSGPLVNSLGAAERYYESFGRLWERAALLRARPVAGDLELGDEVLRMLSPFVWRRRVDPRIAVDMVELAARSRAELSVDPARDLKLGPGGIREAEFFVQTLELIWGGKEPRVRARGTIDGLRRLRSFGLVTDREGREITAGYLALRRAEHAVQVASGQQTHVRPEGEADLGRLARSLGFPDAASFLADTALHTALISERFLSLLPTKTETDAEVEGDVAEAGPARSSRWIEAIAALERGTREAFVEAVARACAGASDPGAPERWADIGRDVFELSRHPDGPLGARTLESFPLLGETVLSAVADAADPSLAARSLRAFFARIGQPAVYVSLLGADPRAVRRLVEVLGASAFIADAMVNHPELGDLVLFTRTHPTPEVAAAEVATALAEGRASAAAEDGEDPDEAFVGGLRRAKTRFTLEVGLADLGTEIGTREATVALSALADASLEAALRHALGTPEGEEARGLSVVAMGKLGGREIGYGSDLDVLFLFDPAAAPPGRDPDAHFARCARRIIRLISISHPAGPGYELDTRLRPSGSQGLLVTSVDAFARYHGIRARGTPPEEGGPMTAHVRAAAWERLALLRARAAAGDAALGAEAIRIAHAAAYTMVDDIQAVAREIHRLRMRMETESSLERKGRYDLKLGRGGLVDIEFAVQLLQMKHGRDPAVRTTETALGIDVLAAAGYLAPEDAGTLRDGYAFLRKLEQRIRIVHATPGQLLGELAPGLLPLARRMGIRDRPGAEATAELMARYRDVTERVREAYERIVVGEAGAA